MATTVQQIDTWRAARSEDQRLEFKEAKTQFDNNKLYKYCVALANEGGGYLLMGVEDQPPRRVVGTSAFRDPIDMAGKIFQALGFRGVWTTHGSSGAPFTRRGAGDVGNVEA